jgi:hypothetical protein
VSDPANESQASQTGPTASSVRPPVLLAGVAASALLIAYLVMLGVLFTKTDEEATQWARYLGVLGGIEALAFAAAGWLFGREVARATIEQADSRTADATARANHERLRADLATAEAVQAKGQAIATASDVRTFLAGRSVGGGLEGMEEGASAAENEVLARAHQVLERYGVV